MQQLSKFTGVLVRDQAQPMAAISAGSTKLWLAGSEIVNDLSMNVFIPIS